jgi:fumarate reductase subunit C
MSGKPAYTPFHPRWYRVRVSTWWWLKRRSSLVFILRELSSIFVAWFILFLLLLLRSVSHGEGAYQEFLRWSARPGILLFNLVSLFFVLFHAITWFNLAPRALVVHVGQKPVPGSWIAASNYAAWLLVSAALAWLLLVSR